MHCYCSVTQSCLTLCDPMDCSMPGFLSFTISLNLLKLMSIESVMPSNRLILCCPLLFLASIFPNIRVFSNESALCIRKPKYRSFSLNMSPSNEYSGLTFSFSIDRFDLLAAQGLSRVLSNSTVWKHQLFCSQFCVPILTSIRDYWKNHSIDYVDLCRENDASSFQYNVLACISFCSKNEVSLIYGYSRFFNLWLQSPSTVILEP